MEDEWEKSSYRSHFCEVNSGRCLTEVLLIRKEVGKPKRTGLGALIRTHATGAPSGEQKVKASAWL